MLNPQVAIWPETAIQLVMNLVDYTLNVINHNNDICIAAFFDLAKTFDII